MTTWQTQARKRLEAFLRKGKFLSDDENVRRLQQLLADLKFPRTSFEWYVQVRNVLGWTPSVEDEQPMACPTCKRP